MKKQMKKIYKENPHFDKNELIARSGDPIISQCHPLKYFGAISEKMDYQLANYVKKEC